jgi:hypothetical protein
VTHGRKYGEKESRPIPVWNGVLEHRRKIKSALWEFVWCLDKITEEDETGTGWVLGKAPVKSARIAEDLEENEKTVRDNLIKLREGKYITLRRTPYGFVIGVSNSKKFGIWRSKESGEKARSDNRERRKGPITPEKSSDLTGEKLRNKEDAAVDATVDAAVAAAPPTDGLNPWKVLGSDLPMGSPRFQKIFEHYYATRNGNSLSDAMERAIQRANKTGARVPPPFFDAKRAVERREAEELTSPADTERPELEELPWGKR